MNDRERYRYGAEQDPAISIEDITSDLSTPHCFRLRIGGLSVTMHARSMADLAHKSNIAALDWIGKNGHLDDR